ncbi:hypothetical protein B5F76_08345 [Desulfovibrio sp. An276]|uniref:hypothetical protein n=1 Tax=Desulfovibrio sp. An276 TaxID=1965618 RepID=UPI000B36C5BB|nr:hypothetical protein [Desulfovibrio sp. An276]OUO52013.1 hypothetical protein B5F76_08345 [Desulfovibrio sp. An276]
MVGTVLLIIVFIILCFCKVRINVHVRGATPKDDESPVFPAHEVMNYKVVEIDKDKYIAVFDNDGKPVTLIPHQ